MATITGIQTINSTALLEVDGDPRLLGGLDGDIGDFAIDTLTGDLYVKKTASPTGWEHVNQRNNFIYTTTVIQTSTSTTPANITQMTTESLPVGTYVFEVFGIFQSTATATGIGFRFNSATATVGNIIASWKIAQGGNGTDKYFEYEQFNLTVNIVTANVPAANTDLKFSARGYFTVTAEGTVAIQFRSETTNAVSVRPNSILVVRRVA